MQYQTVDSSGVRARGMDGLEFNKLNWKQHASLKQDVRVCKSNASTLPRVVSTGGANPSKAKVPPGVLLKVSRIGN